MLRPLKIRYILMMKQQDHKQVMPCSSSDARCVAGEGPQNACYRLAGEHDVRTDDDSKTSVLKLFGLRTLFILKLFQNPPRSFCLYELYLLVFSVLGLKLKKLFISLKKTNKNPLHANTNTLVVVMKITIFSKTFVSRVALIYIFANLFMSS